MSTSKIQFYDIHHTIINHLLKSPSPQSHAIGQPEVQDIEAIESFLKQPLLISSLSGDTTEAEAESAKVAEILVKSSKSQLSESDKKTLESFRVKISKIKMDKSQQATLRKLIGTLSQLLKPAKVEAKKNEFEVAINKMTVDSPEIGLKLQTIFNGDEANGLTPYGTDDRVQKLSKLWERYYNKDEYEKILAYCRAAEVFENNGDPYEHALKLAVLFGTAQETFKALDTFALQSSRKVKGQEGEPDKIIKRSEGTFVHDACSSFTLPQNLKWQDENGSTFNIHWERWKDLMSKDISDFVFSTAFSRADSIESFYANLNAASLEENSEKDNMLATSMEEFYNNEVAEAPRTNPKYLSLPLIKEKIDALRDKIDSPELNQALKELTQYMMRSKRSFSDLDKDALQGLALLKAEPLQDKIKFKLKVIKETQNDAQKLAKLETSTNALLKSYVLSMKKQGKPFEQLDKLAILGVAKIQNESLKPILQFMSKKGLSDATIIEFENLDRKDAGIHIPDIMIWLPQYPKHYLRKLDVRTDDDNAAKGACLGKIIGSGCCQSMGDAGSECAVNGLTSPNGGFLVMCEGDPDNPSKDDLILAQSWVWRGPNEEFCFDSIEFNQTKITKNKIISDFFYAATLEIIKKDAGITKIFIGANGMTPKNIGFSSDIPPATVKDYNGYRDSYSQRVLYHEQAPYALLIDQAVNDIKSNPVYTKIRKQSTNRLKEELDKEGNLNSSEFLQILVQYIMTSPKHLKDKSLVFENFENLFNFDELSPSQKEKFKHFIDINDRYINLINQKEAPDTLDEILNLISNGAFLHLKNTNNDCILDAIQKSEQSFTMFIEGLSAVALLEFFSTCNFFRTCPHKVTLSVLAKLPEDKRLEAIMSCKDLMGCILLQSMGLENIESTLNLLPINERLIPLIHKNRFSWTILNFVKKTETLETILACLSKEDQKTLLYHQGSSGFSLVGSVEENAKSVQNLFNLYPKSDHLKLLQGEDTNGATLLQRCAQDLECLKAVLALYPNSEEREKALRKPNRMGKSVLSYAVHNTHSLNYLIDNYTKDVDLSVLKEKNRFGKSLICDTFHSPETFNYLRTLYTDEEFTDLLKEKDASGFSVLFYAASYPPIFESIFKYVEDKKSLVQENSSECSLFSNAIQHVSLIKIILPYYPKHKLLGAFKESLSAFKPCNYIPPACDESTIEILKALPKEDIIESHHFIKEIYEELNYPIPEIIYAFMIRQEEESSASKTVGFSSDLVKKPCNSATPLDTNPTTTKPNTPGK